jgi:hypothetical protein
MVFDIGSVLFQLQNLGFFDLILPFLLLFAVIYGILSYTKVFSDNRGVHVIVALVIALLAIRFPFFTDFLNFVSPRIGVGVVVILALLILIGLFTPEKSQALIGGIFMAVGAIVFLVILGQSYNFFGFGGGFFTSEIVAGLILVALLIGVIVAVSVAGGSKRNSGRSAIEKLAPLWER